jgi:uncharacterized coiled-coil protein SlyX
MQDLERRLRVIEDRLNILRQLIENLEHNLVEKDRKIDSKLSQINQDVENLKRAINDVNIKINAILNQLPLFATNERVEVIERYLDLINPFEFLTKKEAERMISKMIDEKVKEMLKKREESTI